MKTSALSKGLRYHLEWKNRFRRFLNGKGEMAASEIVSPENCRFGKWLSSDETFKHVSTPTRQELERLHNKLHRIAKRMYELRNAGNLTALRQELKDFDDLCMKLVSLLSAKNVLGVSASEESSRSLMALLTNPLFKKGLFDFFQKVQQDGIEAARTFWVSYSHQNMFPPQVLTIYEKLMDLYADMSLMPQASYNRLRDECEKVHLENLFLTETFTQIQLKIFSESGERVREAWKSIVYGQIEMNRGVAERFFGLFRQTSTYFYGQGEEKPSGTGVKRREVRHKFSFPIEFALKDVAHIAVRGVILNISDSGLCIDSSISLNRGQEIIVRSSLPIRPQTFTVRWTNATITGLSS